ncbi:MAG: hypothetical protein KIT25_23730 [Enhydrobacter sp.]|nr:MAG: hypothetical protein KIT25_23730 [Enhydrobacter sp.]
MPPLIPSRRALLLGAVAATLPGMGATAAGLAATPSQTEGPFYPTVLPIDTDNDLVQVRGHQASAMGTVIHLDGRVLDVGGRPLSGARVEIWQCDAQGIYDHPRQRGRERRDAAFQGFGRVLTRSDGGYGFRTLKPVAYPGRAPHIHVKVMPAAGRGLTTQFYVAGEAQNERDFIFREIARDPRQLERVEMVLRPAPGIEAGALAATLDIVIG